MFTGTSIARSWYSEFERMTKATTCHKRREYREKLVESEPDELEGAGINLEIPASEPCQCIDWLRRNVR